MSSSTASNSSSGSSSAKKLKLNSGKPAASAEHKSGKTKVIIYVCLQKPKRDSKSIKSSAKQLKHSSGKPNASTEIQENKGARERKRESMYF